MPAWTEHPEPSFPHEQGPDGNVQGYVSTLGEVASDHRLRPPRRNIDMGPQAGRVGYYVLPAPTHAEPLPARIYACRAMVRCRVFQYGNQDFVGKFLNEGSRAFLNELIQLHLDLLRSSSDLPKFLEEHHFFLLQPGEFRP